MSTDADAVAVAALIDRHPGMTAGVARFLIALHEHPPGRIATYGALSQRLEQMTAEYPSKEILRTSAKRARRFGFEIEAVYDVGYRMALPGGEDVFRFRAGQHNLNLSGSTTVDDQR